MKYLLFDNDNNLMFYKWWYKKKNTLVNLLIVATIIVLAAVSFNDDILNTTNVSLKSLHPEIHSIDSSIKRRNSTMKPLHSKETEAKKITKIPRQIIKEHRWHSTSLMYAIFHILTVVWHNVSPLMVVFWDHRVVAIVRARNKKKRKKKKGKKARPYKRKKKRRKAKGTVSSDISNDGTRR